MKLENRKRFVRLLRCLKSLLDEVRKEPLRVLLKMLDREQKLKSFGLKANFSCQFMVFFDF